MEMPVYRNTVSAVPELRLLLSCSFDFQNKVWSVPRLANPPGAEMPGIYLLKALSAVASVENARSINDQDRGGHINAVFCA